jgi:hypothetical protein
LVRGERLTLSNHCNKTSFSPVKAAIPNAGGLIEQITGGLIARNPASMKVKPKVAALVLVMITDAVSRQPNRQAHVSQSLAEELAADGEGEPRTAATKHQTQAIQLCVVVQTPDSPAKKSKRLIN